jgi:choline/glycine/proline betaine transport protein
MLFIIFMAYITFRYGHVQFGTTPDGEPEFSTLSYCCMIFAAGVSVGMLLFHVSEPLSHQTGHYFANAGYRSQDEVDMFAINMAVTNWGVTGWITFLVVAVCMSLAGHVYALPMTFRSCFFPILGPYTWGWMGDGIDSLAIIVTITGICTTLGLCAVHIVVGLQYLGWVDAHSTMSHITSVETATIWIMTFMATASAISGLRGGIRLLSLFALALSTLMLLLVTVLDDAKFLLNLQVQELGYYIQYTTLQLHTWTDAFGQLRAGSGRAVDGKAADETWMDYWMIYTQASVYVRIYASHVLCVVSFALVYFTLYSLNAGKVVSQGCVDCRFANLTPNGTISLFRSTANRRTHNASTQYT